jgi:hypothetical protein
MCPSLRLGAYARAGPTPPAAAGRLRSHRIAPGRPSPSVRGDWAEEPSVGRHGPRTGSMGTQRQRNAVQERRHSLLKKKSRGAILFIFYSNQQWHNFWEWMNERNNGALSALHTLDLQINIVCSVHCHMFDLIYKKIFIIFIYLNKFIKKLDLKIFLIILIIYHKY